MNANALQSSLKSSIPWVVAALLLLYLFRQYPLGEIVEASKSMNPACFLLFLLAYFSYVTLTDSWGMNMAFRLFGVNSNLLSTLQVRLSSNLAMIINYGLGQGVMAYFIKKQFQISISKSGSILVFILVTDLYVVCSLSFIGSNLSPALVGNLDLTSWIHVAWYSFTLLICGAFVSRYTARNTRIYQHVSNFEVLNVFLRSSPRDFLRVVLWRLPLHFASCTFLYLLAPVFDAHLPLVSVITFLPIVVAISAVPITPSGLGTEQVSAIFLLQGFVTSPAIESGRVSGAETIFAMSLVLAIGMYFLKLVTGAISLRRMLKN